MLVSLSGPARSGKDSIGDVLTKGYGFTRIAFADQLKLLVSSAFCIDLAILHGPEKDNIVNFVITKDHLVSLISNLSSLGIDITQDQWVAIYNKYNNYLCPTYRNILQEVGSGICRELIANDIWVKITRAQILSCDGNVVVTDARLPNERTMIKELGGYLGLVKRPGYVDPKIDYSHPSENDFGDESEYDLIFNNNGTLVGFQHEVGLWYFLRTSKSR